MDNTHIVSITAFYRNGGTWGQSKPCIKAEISAISEQLQKDYSAKIQEEINDIKEISLKIISIN